MSGHDAVGATVRVLAFGSRSRFIFVLPRLRRRRGFVGLLLVAVEECQEKAHVAVGAVDAR